MSVPQFTDTHCHLQFDDYNDDRAEVIARARQAGIKRIIVPGTDLADSRRALELAGSDKDIWATAGQHPHSATDFLKNPTNLQLLGELLTSPKVVAVGEIGLDYYRMYSPKKDQREALKLQIEAGLSSGKPFVFHVREAFDDFWPLFDGFGPPLRGVIHSFSDTPDQLEQALNRGLYIALNGIMTYTDNPQWLAAAKKVPLKRLLLETDAPFLAPVAIRGQRCEPKDIADIAKFLANLRGETLEELSKATTANGATLFGFNKP